MHAPSAAVHAAAAHHPHLSFNPNGTVMPARRRSSPGRAARRGHAASPKPAGLTAAAAAPPVAAAAPATAHPSRYALRMTKHSGSGGGSGSNGRLLAGSKRPRVMLRGVDEEELLHEARRAPPPAYAAAASTYVPPVPSDAHSTSKRGLLPVPFPMRERPTNILQQLTMRQHHSQLTTVALRRDTYAHRFSRMKLQHTLDTHVPEGMEGLNVEPRAGKITEIAGAGNFLFALTQSGICTAYDRSRGFKRICCLNVVPDEIIRSLFYNRANKSLITVSVFKHDYFVSLRCRSTGLQAILDGKPELGLSLFASECLQWPGFVEFDDVNRKVVTFSASSNLYKVWDLATYAPLFQLSDRAIDEVKISPGVMLLIHHRVRDRVPLKIVNIENGELLQSFTHTLPIKAKVAFIEQFNEKLLVKQKCAPLQMVDVAARWSCRELSESQFPTPAAFIFLYENALFLTFVKRQIATWNFKGEKVAHFEDHDNWFPDCNTSNVFINPDQDLLLSYCLTPRQSRAHRERLTNPEQWKRLRDKSGSVNVSHIFTGRCLLKLERMRKKQVPLALLSLSQRERALVHQIHAHEDDVFIRARSIDPFEQVVSEREEELAEALARDQEPHTDRILHQERALEHELQITRRAIADAVAAAAKANGREAQPVTMYTRASTRLPLEQLTSPIAAPLAAAAGVPVASNTAAAALAHGAADPAASDASMVAPPAAAAAVAPAGDAAEPAAEVEGVQVPVQDADDEEEDDDDDEWLFEYDEAEEVEQPRSSDDSDDEDNDDLEDMPHRRDMLEAQRAALDLDGLTLDDIQFPMSTRSAKKAASSAARRAAAKRAVRPSLCAGLGWEPRLESVADYQRYNAYVRQHNRALKRVTACFYNEEHNEIYTGNHAGDVNVWAQ